MISEANQKTIEAARLSFILGMRIPQVPYVVGQWHREHPGEEIPDGHVFYPALARRAVREAPEPGHLLLVQPRPDPIVRVSAASRRACMLAMALKVPERSRMRR